MKKLIVVSAIVLILLAGGSLVFAQEQEGATESEAEASGLRLFTVPLERVWAHSRGYVVEYRRSGNRIARAYLPIEWFAWGEANRGEVISLPPGSSMPSMSVFFRDGELSFVRLYVHRSPSHPSWGSVPQHLNIDRNFENVETIELEF